MMPAQKTINPSAIVPSYPVVERLRGALPAPEVDYVRLEIDAVRR
jgi:hypothetical protein